MKVLGILQARMSSSRLPGKVLRPILGRPMLAHQVERIRRARLVDDLTIATSDEPSDDAVERFCETLGVDCFRGRLHDVLDRYYQAAVRKRPEHVMRLTGDCPLTDPALLDALVELHLRDANDYTSNAHERTYPDGLDAELFRMRTLEEAWNNAKTAHEREHVTPYMYRTCPVLKRGALKDVVDRSAMRWTVDHPEDFELVDRIFTALYPLNAAFGTDDVHRLLLAHPEIAALNAHWIV